MACCRPFVQKIKGSQSYFTIPCGYCLSCRADRRNQWSDRAKYELSQCLSSTFLTLTYSNEWLSACMSHSSWSGELMASLNYHHVETFIQRLRKYIRRHSELHSPLCCPDFKYILVGEYGDGADKTTPFPRPHFHILFFGLDFAFCRNLFEAEWKFGLCDSLPLLDGCINYVLKYIDKQYKGDQAFYQYDLHGLARPSMRCSLSFGSGLFRSPDKFMYEDNNWTYPCGRGLRRPMPPYFKKQYLSYSPNFTVSLSELKDKMTTYNLRNHSAKSRSAFQTRMSRLRERKLYLQALQDGIPAFDYLSDSDIFFSPNYQKLKGLSVGDQRALGTGYINFIKEVTNYG